MWLLSYILTALFALLPVIFKKKRKLETAMYIVVILSTIVSGYDRWDTDSNNTIIQDSLKYEIRTLQSRNDSLHSVLYNNVLGRGHPVISLIGTGKPNEYVLLLENNSKYPNFRISMSFYALETLYFCERRKGEQPDTLFYDQLCLNTHSWHYQEDEIPAYDSRSTSPIHIANSENLQYLLMIFQYSSRSAIIVQESVIKLGKGKCKQNYRIMRGDPSALDGNMTLVTVDEKCMLDLEYHKSWHEAFPRRFRKPLPF